MTVIQSFLTKEVAALTAGELFAMDMGGRALCIAVDPHQQGMARRTIVLSSPGETTHPYWTQISLDVDCLSYGFDWEIDLLDARETYPGQVQLADQAGTIIVSPSSTLLRAGTDGGSFRERPAHFDLTTHTLANRGADLYSAVCIRTWKLWLNEADRLRPGARPMFEFNG